MFLREGAKTTVLLYWRSTYLTSQRSRLQGRHEQPSRAESSEPALANEADPSADLHVVPDREPARANVVPRSIEPGAEPELELEASEAPAKREATEATR